MRLHSSWLRGGNSLIFGLIFCLFLTTSRTDPYIVVWEADIAVFELLDVDLMLEVISLLAIYRVSVRIDAPCSRVKHLIVTTNLVGEPVEALTRLIDCRTLNLNSGLVKKDSSHETYGVPERRWRRSMCLQIGQIKKRSWRIAPLGIR